LKGERVFVVLGSFKEEERASLSGECFSSFFFFFFLPLRVRTVAKKKKKTF
jgi:hypothetical protein